VLGAAGVHFLVDDRVEGEDPLAPFGANAADHLRRLDGFSNIGDIMVNSTYDQDLEEVAAFEELVGSHGGMGGPQTRPFLLHPVELASSKKPLVGAPAVHEQLRRWADQIGVAGDAVLRPRDGDDLPEPSGLRWVGAWLILQGLFLLLVGGLLVAAAVIELAEQLPAELIEAPALVGAFGLTVSLLLVATGIGIIRHRRWAWKLALVYQGVSVLYLIMALASEGLSAIVAFGVIPALIAVAVFYYLTRPHVAAAFKPRRYVATTSIPAQPGDA
jgi:hypothetical protein